MSPKFQNETPKGKYNALKFVGRIIPHAEALSGKSISMHDRNYPNYEAKWDNPYLIFLLHT